MIIPIYEDVVVERYLNTVEVYELDNNVSILQGQYNFYTHDEASELAKELTKEFADDNDVSVEIRRTPIYTILD